MHVIGLVISITYLLFPAVGLGKHSIDVEHCQASLVQELAQGRLPELSSSQREFVLKTLLPAAGLRTLYKANGKVRQCEATDQCMVLPFDEAKDLRFQWVATAAKQPWIEVGAEANTLMIPEGYAFDDIES